MEKVSRNTIQSVERALLLLEVISSEKEIVIRELSNKTGLKRSIVQRLSTLKSKHCLKTLYSEIPSFLKLFQIWKQNYSANRYCIGNTAYFGKINDGSSENCCAWNN